MESQSEIIAKKIESGKYYSEAMVWFHEKFTKARTEFAYFFIISIVAVVAFVWAFLAFMEIFPLSPGKNFVMSRNITANERLTIHGVQDVPGETANDSIMKFMLKEYVKAREEYIEDKLDRNFRVVTSFSNNDVYKEFLDETSTSNPQNPMIQYGKQASRSITINDIKLLNSVGKPAHDTAASRAIVNYTTILTYTSDNTQHIEQREADISFQHSEITVNQESGKISHFEPLVVTGYKTNSIKTQ